MIRSHKLVLLALALAAALPAVADDPGAKTQPKMTP